MVALINISPGAIVRYSGHIWQVFQLSDTVATLKAWPSTHNVSQATINRAQKERAPIFLLLGATVELITTAA